MRAKVFALTTMLASALLLGGPVAAEEVGRVGTDWTGNDVVVDAITDPEVAGITCHVSYFERGLIDRLWQGNWFSDPSNSSIACRRTGKVVIGTIDGSDRGEEIFSQRQSLIFKALAVRRIYDAPNDTLIYLAYSRQIKEGSAKMAISTIPLIDTDAQWTQGKPR